MHNSKLVVGDVVKIEEGMNVPCDGLVIKGNEVLTDESAMTGEPDNIKKASITTCLSKKEVYLAEQGSQSGRTPPFHP